ncbi:hypothetical protein NQZ68_001148 [Dissostichus eleginoides]|nr:hypothetical protein NQZ68_001148 [Dissostichus eleginoides]
MDGKDDTSWGMKGRRSGEENKAEQEPAWRRSAGYRLTPGGPTPPPVACWHPPPIQPSPPPLSNAVTSTVIGGGV